MQDAERMQFEDCQLASMVQEQEVRTAKEAHPLNNLQSRTL